MIVFKQKDFFYFYQVWVGGLTHTHALGCALSLDGKRAFLECEDEGRHFQVEFIIISYRFTQIHFPSYVKSDLFKLNVTYAFPQRTHK
jgi:hypothetical protein